MDGAREEMNEHRLVSGAAREDDTDRTLRPQVLADFVGRTHS
jgi:Holliday junction DNA helicase RuvB